MTMTPRDHLATVRQACKLIDDVRDGEPDRLRGPVAASVIELDPMRIAEILIILAGCADIERATPGDVYDRLDALGTDLGDLPKYAHSVYQQYASRRSSDQAAGWVRTGERIYQRNKARRLRKAAA